MAPSPGGKGQVKGRSAKGLKQELKTLLCVCFHHGKEKRGLASPAVGTGQGDTATDQLHCGAGTGLLGGHSKSLSFSGRFIF